MLKQAGITLENNIFFISGDLDFFNVMSVYQTSLPLLEKPSVLHFDFSRLHSSDSAGLALIIEWMKWADTHRKSIQISHFPNNLLSIAKAAGLDQLGVVF